MILVKAGKLGERIREYAVADGTLVNTLLSTANIHIDVTREDVHVVVDSSSNITTLHAACVNGSILIVEPKTDPLLNKVIEHIEDEFDVHDEDAKECARELIEIIRGR